MRCIFSMLTVLLGVGITGLRRFCTSLIVVSVPQCDGPVDRRNRNRLTAPVSLENHGCAMCLAQVPANAHRSRLFSPVTLESSCQ